MNIFMNMTSLTPVLVFADVAKWAAVTNSWQRHHWSWWPPWYHSSWWCCQESATIVQKKTWAPILVAIALRASSITTAWQEASKLVWYMSKLVRGDFGQHLIQNLFFAYLLVDRNGSWVWWVTISFNFQIITQLAHNPFGVTSAPVWKAILAAASKTASTPELVFADVS